MTPAAQWEQTYDRAVRFAKVVLVTAKDWQDAQHALADDKEFGPWIADAGDELGLCQDIIREAEKQLEDALPY